MTRGSHFSQEIYKIVKTFLIAKITSVLKINGTVSGEEAGEINASLLLG
jgi:hypothetical protein